MTADTRAARAAAQLHEAARDLERLALAGSPGSPEGIGVLADLAADFAGRYHLHAERPHAERALRYVAIARNLRVRPYAIVTADPDELRQALGQPDAACQA